MSLVPSISEAVLVSGNHFHSNESGSICDGNITILALKMLQNPETKCPKAVPCKYSEYSTVSREQAGIYLL